MKKIKKYGCEFILYIFVLSHLIYLKLLAHHPFFRKVIPTFMI